MSTQPLAITPLAKEYFAKHAHPIRIGDTEVMTIGECDVQKLINDIHQIDLPDPSRSLARKIAEITKILKPLERTKEVEIKGEKFKVASQEDVIALVNKEIAERNIAIFPDTVRFDHDRDITRLLVEFTIEDGDSGETRKFKVPGEGQDKTDKGASKALSAANKNMLIKLFQIPTIEAGASPAVEQRKAEIREERSAKPADRVNGMVMNIEQYPRKGKTQSVTLTIGKESFRCFEVRMFSKLPLLQGKNVTAEIVYKTKGDAVYPNLKRIVVVDGVDASEWFKSNSH